ncbi:MAG: hypothetical protein PHS46_08100 [Candidatus Omnitrophica bacterium]|nr:hypothetical protein [Candidatus Omnitrophota bacterium]
MDKIEKAELIFSIMKGCPFAEDSSDEIQEIIQKEYVDCDGDCIECLVKNLDEEQIDKLLEIM